MRSSVVRENDDPLRFAKQRAVPSCVSGRGRCVESREQSGLKRLVILFPRASGAKIVMQTTEPLALKTSAPLAHRAGADPQLPGDLARRHTLRSTENNPCPQRIPSLRLGLAQHGFELFPLIAAEDDWRGWA